MILLQGIISGLFATIIFDLYQLSLKYGYGIEKPQNQVGKPLEAIRKITTNKCKDVS